MINLLKRNYNKIKSEFKFLSQQKWGIIKCSDKFGISKSILKKYLPVNSVIVDCGAHDGTDSIELARIFPLGKIHSFEPIPDIYNSLLTNSKKYKNIQTYPIALGSNNEKSEMFVSSGNSDASSSLLEPSGHKTSHPDVFFKKKIIVNVYTLSEWARKNNINKIDFLWLDMQGYELQMLKASENILENVKCIFTEVSMTETYLNAVHYLEYRKWLETKGFRVLLEAIPQYADMGNVLFVKN